MRLISVAVATSLVAFSVAADPLPAPTGPTVVALTGAVAQPNAVVLDHEGFAAIGQATLTTTTGWEFHDGPQTFSGVPAAALLAAAGMSGDDFVITAGDGYAVAITREELTGHGALFATEHNGELLAGKSYGPIWLVFDYAAMADDEQRELFKALSVWAVVSIRAE